METGFEVHVAGGAIALAIFVVASVYFLPQTPLVLLLSALLFMVGAVLPDVDSDRSRVGKAFNAFVFLAVLILGGAALVQNKDALYGQCAKAGMHNDLACGALVPLLAIIAAYAAAFILRKTMPPHRGVFHSLPAAFAYGFLLMAGALAAGFAVYDAAFVGFAGGAGYFTHLLIDEIGDATKLH
jgi:hypothetical protein